MFRPIAKTLVILLTTASLAACSGAQGPKETGGTLVGAAVGGLVGSTVGGGSGQLAAVAVGTLMGAFLGREVGQSLDRADQLYAGWAASRGLEHKSSGATTQWSNPDSGHSGTFTPLRTYREPSGQYCREYRQTVTVGGQTERAYGTACRQPDGSWKIGGDTSSRSRHPRINASAAPNGWPPGHSSPRSVKWVVINAPTLGGTASGWPISSTTCYPGSWRLRNSFCRGWWPAPHAAGHKWATRRIRTRVKMHSGVR